MIVGILLAAGYSRRFGGAKLVARLQNGVRVVDQSAGAFLAALPHTVAVVHEDSAELAVALGRAGAQVEVADDAMEGMGASLACAARAVLRHWPEAVGVVIGLADMPWLTAAEIARVGDALVGGADVARLRYRMEAGHPVGFSRRWFAALAALEGDRGARDLFEIAESITWIDSDDQGCVRDVDTAADLIAP